MYNQYDSLLCPFVGPKQDTCCSILVNTEDLPTAVVRDPVQASRYPWGLDMRGQSRHDHNARQVWLLRGGKREGGVEWGGRGRGGDT